MSRQKKILVRNGARSKASLVGSPLGRGAATVVELMSRDERCCAAIGLIGSATVSRRYQVWCMARVLAVVAVVLIVDEAWFAV